MFMTKSAAAREKDRLFNIALLIHGYVKVEDALQRVPDMPVSASRQRRIESFIRRVDAQAQERLRKG